MNLVIGTGEGQLVNAVRSVIEMQRKKNGGNNLKTTQKCISNKALAVTVKKKLTGS